MTGSKVKEIDPTSTYIRIARKMGYRELNGELFKQTTTDLQACMNAISDETDDDMFEFLEQQSHFNQLTKDGFELVIESSHPVMADDISSIPPGPAMIPCGAAIRGRSRGPQISNFVPPEINQKENIPLQRREVPPEMNLTFDQLCAKLSPAAQSKMVKENMLHQIVLASVSNEQIRSFNFSAADEMVMKNLIIQCRARALKATQPEKKRETKMPRNEITDRLPLEGKVTLRALKKKNLLCPVKLYLTTSYEEITELFNNFPSIPQKDQQNIYTGMAMARYASKYGKSSE
jgi:hypothetical protein